MRIFGVEVAGGLVRQDHIGIVRERTRDGDALLFATGEMAARARQFFAQADGIEQLGRARPACRLPSIDPVGASGS